MNAANIAQISSLPATLLDETTKSVLSEVEEVVVFSLPMNIKFRGITVREGLLLRGPGGWGEVSPFWDYDPKESSRWLQSGIECAKGLESLKWHRDLVPVNLTIPVTGVEEARRRILDQAGCKTAKVKVADPERMQPKDPQDPGSPSNYLGVGDVERVAAVSALMAELYGEEARVRVDANTAWNVEEARQALAILNEAAAPVGGLEYAEQPVRTTVELAELHGLTDVPVAADESIRRAENPLDVARLRAADVGVVKVQPLGGITEAMEVSAAIGLPTTVSSALDSSVGLAAGVAMSAAMKELPFAGGLNTATMFAADLVDDPLIAEGGDLNLEHALAVAMGELTKTSRSVDADVVDRWARRLNAMAHSLARDTAVPWWPGGPLDSGFVSGRA